MLVTKIVRSGNIGSGSLSYTTFSSGFVDPGICECRITASSGTPVNDGVCSGIFVVPYKGNRVSLFISGSWQIRTVPNNQFLAVGNNSGNTLDYYLNDTTGLNNVQLSAITNGGQSAQVVQDGVVVLSGNPGYKYIGTSYCQSSGMIFDFSDTRSVYNYYNRVTRTLAFTGLPNLSFWSGGVTGGSGWTPALGFSGASVVDVVVGYPEDNINLTGRLGTQVAVAMVTAVGLATIGSPVAGLNGSNPSGFVNNQIYNTGFGVTGQAINALSCNISYFPNYGWNSFYLWQFQPSSGASVWEAGYPTGAEQIGAVVVGSFLM